MREQRYLFQGAIVLLFLLANLICSGTTEEFAFAILPNSISGQNKLSGLQILSAAILAIAVSPSLGYLVYALRHAVFLACGGWGGLYKMNGVKPFIDNCPDYININDLDVKASWYLCYTKDYKEYVEWIRRRMDAYLTSSSISLEILIVDVFFYLIMNLSGMVYNIDRLIHLWEVSLFFIAIFLYIASVEKKKGAEGFKLFFHQVANASSGQWWCAKT